MKEFIVIRKNDLFAGQVCESFDTLEDAILYRDLMSRNGDKLASGKPMWDYYVFQMHECETAMTAAV